MQTAFRSEERFTQREFRDWIESQPASDLNRYELLDGRIVTRGDGKGFEPPVLFTTGQLALRVFPDLGLTVEEIFAGLD